MLLRPGHLTVRRRPAAVAGSADALLAETGDSLRVETGLTLIKE